jgi:hypothetical protein
MQQQTYLCRLFRHILIFCSILLLPGIFTEAQSQSNATKPVYVVYTYMKTLPGKFDAYDSLLRNTSKNIYSNQIQEGNYLSWSAYEVLMPSGSQVEYNVVGVTVSDKLDMLLDPPGTVKDLYAKTFPDLTSSQRDDLMKKYVESRTIIKREIYTVTSSTGDDGPPTKTPAKYVQVDYMTPAQGKQAQYVKMEKETFKPIHKQRMQLGALEGWVLLEKVMPYDSNDHTPYVTVNFYDSFSEMLDDKYNEAIKKAHPTLDMTKVMQTMNAVKKGQRSELWKLITTTDMQAK